MVGPACCVGRPPSKRSCASQEKTESRAMGAFEYTALDSTGKERKGILEGDTPRHVRQMLREKQLLPVAVGEVAQREAKRQQQRSFTFSRGISSGDLSLFTRQLATLVRAGLPLEESLLAVSQQTEIGRASCRE